MAEDRRASRLKRESSQNRKDATKKVAPSSSSRGGSKVVVSRDSSRNTSERNKSKEIANKATAVSKDPSAARPKIIASKQAPSVITSGEQHNATITATAASNSQKRRDMQKTLSKKVILNETVSKSQLNRKKSSILNKEVPTALEVKDKNVRLISASKMQNTAKHDSRSASRLSRDRTRTRTLSPGESKLRHLTPEAVGPVEDQVLPQDDSTQDDYYESDFESDFESESTESDDESSTSEEEKPEEFVTLPAPAPRSLHTSTTSREPVLSDKGTMERPNMQQPQSETKQRVSFDLAIKDDKHTLSETPTINFSLARKKQVRLQAAEKARTRGRELLSMLKLDTVSFTLLDLPPSKYEVLMSAYGVQAQTQTGEGRLEEEVQTDAVINTEKWTQHPACPEPNLQGLQAVGPTEEKEDQKWPSIDYLNLEKSVNRAAELMFILLAEEDINNEENSVIAKLDLSELVDGGYLLGAEVQNLLANKPATLVKFVDRLKLLSLHPKMKQEDKDLICLWSTFQPSQPLHILGSRAFVNTLCVHPEWPNFVIAGCKDGLAVWNLLQAAYYHPYEMAKGRKVHIRTPAFTTSESGAESHVYAVVRVLAKSGDQFLSVDEIGHVIIWSLIKGDGLESGTSYRLIRSTTMQVSVGDAEVTDAEMCGDRLIVALNSGEIINLSLIGKHTKRILEATDDEASHGITNIFVSPNSKQHFLVQEGKGGMRVHQLGVSRALWSSPLHELGDSSPWSVSWGSAGLVCIIPGHVFLWHIPQNKPILSCSVPVEIIAIDASPFSTQVVVSTRKGGLYILNIKNKLCTDEVDI